MKKKVIFSIVLIIAGILIVIVINLSRYEYHSMWGFKIANFINSHYIIRILWLKLNFIIKVKIKVN